MKKEPRNKRSLRNSQQSTAFRKTIISLFQTAAVVAALAVAVWAVSQSVLAQSVPQPVLSISTTGTNQVLINITNGVSTANYELYYALGLTGLILTKLDGTAKGGAICAIAKERPVPVLFVGVGESIDDLRPFSAREFAEALIG